MLKHLVVLSGPTGVGKTDTAIQLAQHYNTEIVSADSRQIFRELTVGTAVPSVEELSAAKHHFIQTHSISENYNASRYENEAVALLTQLFKKYDVLFLVGGSMLYIDAVCKGIDHMPDHDPDIRKDLKKQLEKNGLEHLRRQLKKLDPNYYLRVDLKNPNRIIHALEISILTGKPYSSFRMEVPKKRSFGISKFALNCERQVLHERINKRVDLMIQNGLIEEARKVYPLRHLNALNTVGYRELFDFIDGTINQDRAIDLIKRNSRRYARKQISWLNRDENTVWFKRGETRKMIAHLDKYLEDATQR
jgi:tRNA dimethylallyltransferase